MSNIAGKAYAMNVITPMPPWRTWIQTALFMVARVIPTAAVRPARAEAHSFRALGDHPAQSVAGSGRHWPADARPRLHAVPVELQRHLGSVYRRICRRHSSAGSTCSGTPAPNIRIRSRSVRSRAISPPTRSTPTTTTTPRRARRSGTSRRRCACGVNCWRSPTASRRRCGRLRNGVSRGADQAGQFAGLAGLRADRLGGDAECRCRPQRIHQGSRNEA